jgi:hypothetical protein
MNFRWRFLQYVSPSGRKVIDDWRSGLPLGLPRSDVDAFLKVLAKLETWDPPHIKALQGKSLRGLSELRWKSGRVPYRLIGYAQERYEYVLLIGCTHNQRKYDPPSALETAAKRWEQIKRREATVCEYKLITYF